MKNRYRLTKIVVDGHSVIRPFALAVACACVLGGAGCATEETATGAPMEASIPWNRPATWEGPGVYGSSVNTR